MARGTAFSELVLQLRAELRRSQNPAIGAEDLPSLKQTLNHIIDVVAHKRDWPFLHRKFGPLTLNAGQRYHDLPEGLNQERITFSKLKYNGSWYDLVQGIQFADYQSWDSEEGVRADPVLKFDFVAVGESNDLKIELWPIPASKQYLYLEGYADVPKLVSDTDLCPLDDTIVVLFAAAELLQSTGDDGKALAAAKRDLANDILNQKAIRGARNSGAPVQVGLGSGREQFESGRAVIRITGT